MKSIEITLQFLKDFMWNLVLEGSILVLLGVLIFLYPSLLVILVALALIITGILSFFLALKVNKFTQIKFKL